MLFRPITFGGLLNDIFVAGFAFPITCDVVRLRAITAILVALCLRPSAIDPPPLGPSLKTKAEVPFDRAVTERSKPFFLVFPAVQSSPISALFLLSSCPVGRGSQRVMVCILAGC
jgi:hypothetical protein